MTYHVVINTVKTVDEFSTAWTNDDFINLLDLFGFSDAEQSNPEELKELMFMAITDYQPNEAAEIILKYKLSESLNDNQIEQISHEMLLDKISEEYSDISLHHGLFNINQLLYKAFNGIFPNAKATVVEFEITPDKDITKEVVLKAFDKTLTGNSVIKRLYSNHIAGKENFDEAESIIWDLTSKGNSSYTLTTSEYWMSRDEFSEAEFDAEVIEFEYDEEDD